LDKLCGFHGSGGKTVKGVKSYNGCWEMKFKGWTKDFLEKIFVNARANEPPAGPAFPLGDTALIPRAKVLPPFGRSDQSIFADVSHLTASTSYHAPVLLPWLLPQDT
jgi:hypothetical protein